MKKLSNAAARKLERGNVIETASLMPAFAPDDPCVWSVKNKIRRKNGFLLEFEVYWCDCHVRNIIMEIPHAK